MRPNQQEKPRGIRRVISTKNETRAAIVEIMGRANRGLAILTPDLEPEIYDHDDFLEPLKKFLLQRTFARVRVLISDPRRAFKVGNRFVDVARRLNSYIEFRNIKPENCVDAGRASNGVSWTSPARLFRKQINW